MNFKIALSFLLIIGFTSQNFSQFKFSGEVNEEFRHSNIYLSLIDNYKQGNVFLTEKIIQEVQVDSLGLFEFKGDFLPSENKFYKIYIDKCNNNITDYNHLLNHCNESNYLVFIANNFDEIHFPLNNLDQMFCSFNYSRIQNVAIQKIDSIQETLLLSLHESKSDEQRKIIFTNYNKELQKFSESLNEPLAELYSYHLYSHEVSFSRPYYIKDLENSEYYNSLLKRLETSYPNSTYTSQFKNDIERDRLAFKKDTPNPFIIILTVLLLISFLVNIFFFKKQKAKKSKLDYKKILSTQEQKVFELMKNNLSNKEISEALFISVSTVKSHINNIYSKLKISSRKDIFNFK